jgi:ABC-type cobalt transport system, ATPase component
MAQIEINNVFYTYPNGAQALSGASASIEKGERVAVIGRNGAGKTTLVKLINGLLKPTEGRIFIDGKDTAKLTAAKLSNFVSYAFQNPDDQIFNQTVYSEIAFGPKRAGIKAEALEKRVKKAAGACRLENLLCVNPYDLSLTERKFVAIASVLAMETEIVILDEPTAGQDLIGLSLISEIIENLVKDGKTVIAISHDMDFVAENFKRVIVMAEGKKLADGETCAVFGDKLIMEKAGLKPPYICSLSRKLGFNSKIINASDFVTYMETHRKVSRGSAV